MNGQRDVCPTCHQPVNSSEGKTYAINYPGSPSGAGYTVTQTDASWQWIWSFDGEEDDHSTEHYQTASEALRAVADDAEHTISDPESVKMARNARLIAARLEREQNR